MARFKTIGTIIVSGILVVTSLFSTSLDDFTSLFLYNEIAVSYDSQQKKQQQEQKQSSVLIVTNNKTNYSVNAKRKPKAKTFYIEKLKRYSSYDNIIRYNSKNDLNNLCRDFFSGSTCSSILKASRNSSDLISSNINNKISLEAYNNQSNLIHINFNCTDLYVNGGVGSGNFLSAFYGIRMVALSLGSTDVIIQCIDADDAKTKLFLPWFMGIYPSVPSSRGATTKTEDYENNIPKLKDSCIDYKYVPIGWRLNDMIYEMRRMAIALVGIPYAGHPSEAWAKKYLWGSTAASAYYSKNYTYQIPSPQQNDKPLFPNTQIDDAMLHFRCGDIASSNHPSFGFMKFDSFSRHISPGVRTIGIATQPFGTDDDENNHQQRREDGGKGKICKRLVMSFVDHLQEKFPSATISIHNKYNETIALTLARMVMANQTVVGITSFGVFPGVSTFGTGYIRKPDYMKAPNRWLVKSHHIEQARHIQLINEPMIFAGHFRKLWWKNDGKDAIQWFNNYTMKA